MNYPKFYDNIENIKVQDNLASFLGAFNEGIYDFSYLDIVKSAGHSCPTVLGAYLMTKEALKALYPNSLPQRGNIKVEIKDKALDGVTGVISSVITNITGSTKDLGFKGIAGTYDRRYLMSYDNDIESNIKFIRLDTNEAVEVSYDLSSIYFNPRMQELMQKSIKLSASENEKLEFGKLWQDRVENISLNISRVVKVIKV
ncbi:MAG: formylmethanofuran dehydrogenase subunit E family protein [Campylobacterales bacterium]|nr:formylmethanofuran dehydrogenase subunit E family protein [Campylobacterales bacterium]